MKVGHINPKKISLAIYLDVYMQPNLQPIYGPNVYLIENQFYCSDTETIKYAFYDFSKRTALSDTELVRALISFFVLKILQHRKFIEFSIIAYNERIYRKNIY